MENDVQDINEELDIMPDKKITDDMPIEDVKENLKEEVKEETTIVENKEEQLENIDVIEDSNTTSDETEEKSGKKGLLLAILIILLVLDIAALVIYLIGIDKVLSFIK